MTHSADFFDMIFLDFDINKFAFFVFVYYGCRYSLRVVVQANLLSLYKPAKHFTNLQAESKFERLGVRSGTFYFTYTVGNGAGF